MQELLDEPIHASPNSYIIPTRVKVVGIVLALIWGLLLLFDVSALIMIDYLESPLYMGLLVMYALLMGQNSIYKPSFWREKAKKHALILLFSAVGMVVCHFSFYLWRDLWSDLFGLVLVGGLTHFVLAIYKTQPQAARIWSWLQTMVIACTVVLFVRFYCLHSEYANAIIAYHYSYSVFLLVTIYYTFQFYKKEHSNLTHKRPTALFIASAYLVILGQLVYYYYSRYGQSIILLGIGGMALTALYAWIKTAPVDTSQNPSTSD